MPSAGWMLLPLMDIQGWSPAGENVWLGLTFEVNPTNKMLHSHYTRKVPVANQTPKYHSQYLGVKERKTLGTATRGTTDKRN